MRRQFILPVSIAFGLIAIMISQVSHQAQAEVNTGWQMVAPGIEYQKFSIPASDPDGLGPNDVYVARMDRANPNVTIDSMIAQGRLSGGTEPVSGMSNRYEDTINFWDQSWGKRNDVVVAINGYFYGSPIEAPGVPWRGQIQSGWYAKRHDDNENGSGFVWKLDRTAFIGECVSHQASEQIVTFTGTTANTINIDDINTARGADELILYTPQFDQNTLTNNDGVEVLVEMTRPTLILPPTASLLPEPSLPFEEWFTLWSDSNRVPLAPAVGYVRKILDGQGSTPIPFDYIVLSATGGDASKLLNNVQVDAEISISQAVDHKSKDDCSTPIVGKDWTKAYASIGGSFYFLENGLINSYIGNSQATVHDARTAIAYNEDYVFFIVVDQIKFNDDFPNDPADDIVIKPGMNMAELGYFAREWLGADFGIAQDGGGSTTMVINGEVKNVPNDLDADLSVIPCPLPDLFHTLYLPVINRQDVINTNQLRDLLPTPVPANASAAPAETCYKGTERFVANGMMMVVVNPLITSTTFTVGQTVTTNVGANVRLGPGTNYAVLTTLPAGSSGTVKAHMNNLNGVFATGSSWWQVNFGGGVVGWISESVLTGTP